MTSERSSKLTILTPDLDLILGIIHTFFIVSIVDFEQVNISLDNLGPEFWQ